MKRLLIGVLFLFPVILLGQTVEEIDRQFENSKTVAEVEAVAKTISAALAKNANSYDLNWRMAKAVWLKGDLLSIQYTAANVKAVKSTDIEDIFSAEKEFSETQRAVLVVIGTEVRKYSEKAISLNTNGIEGHFYNALGISTYAQGKTIVAALTEGLRGKFNDEVDASLKLNRKFAEGGVLRLAGRAAYKLPWPLRDYEKSVKLLKEATDAFPGGLRSWLYLADTYFQMDNVTEAKAAYNRVMQLTPAGNEIRDSVELKQIAQIKLNALK